MTNPLKYGKHLLLALLLCMLSGAAYAESITKDNVTLVYESLADGTYKVIDVYNNSSSQILLYVDDFEVVVNSGGSAKVNRIAKSIVYFNFPRVSGPTLLRYKEPAPAQPAVSEEPTSTPDQEAIDTAPKPAATPLRNTAPAPAHPASEGGYMAMIENINADAYFGTEAVGAFVTKADALASALAQSQNKRQILIDHDVENLLKVSDTELQLKKAEIPLIAQDLILKANITDAEGQSRIVNSIVELLNTRLLQRKTALDKLQAAVEAIPEEAQSEHSLKETIINYSIVGAIVLIMLVWIIYAIKTKGIKGKKQKSAQAKAPQYYQPQAATPSAIPDVDPEAAGNTIIVRRRTTSMLKKQCIDDVINNPEYLLIDAADFTADSAVKNIYIKNSCIKEVYNMYAEDLRNSENPKEDGCMVLGRWVYDKDSRTYDVTLESVVFPGDDAIFKEYELNFGGKIKLRVAEKLRKLRKDTDLQYDLICWIHSHPGLGVFFSNSDSIVQTMLKHSKHPNFLIAFVVDILTEDQEMGIFTFRKDGAMNSKNDLDKLYSLEDMYKWALESDKASFNPDNYRNLLASAQMKMPGCIGIELNNSSIIDIAQIIVEPSSGIVGWASGSAVDTDAGTEYVVTGVSKTDEKPSAGTIGALINVTHMSLPTIQRLIANEKSKLSFVVVYSSKQGTLTSIPMINGELITDEHFYGEETLDDLKIWTRRKR